MEEGLGGGSKKSYLDLYLNEVIVEEYGNLNSERFPILSKLAHDILAIPISIVAFESAFSTSGRVLDVFRSSLVPKIVEALICTSLMISVKKFSFEHFIL